MNAAVRAVTRMGIYVGAKVFLIYGKVQGSCPKPGGWAPCSGLAGNIVGEGEVEEGCRSLFCQGHWSLFSL